MVEVAGVDVTPVVTRVEVSGAAVAPAVTASVEVVPGDVASGDGAGGGGGFVVMGRPG